MRLAGRLNETRGDTHSITGAADAALNEIVDAQRLADLAGALRGPLECHRGPARNHRYPAAGHGSQLRDHFLCQTVAEVLLRRILTEVGKRQHRQSQSRPQGAWGA